MGTPALAKAPEAWAYYGNECHEDWYRLLQKACFNVIKTTMSGTWVIPVKNMVAKALIQKDLLLCFKPNNFLGSIVSRFSAVEAEADIRKFMLLFDFLSMKKARYGNPRRKRPNLCPLAEEKLKKAGKQALERKPRDAYHSNPKSFKNKWGISIDTSLREPPQATSLVEQGRAFLKQRKFSEQILSENSTRATVICVPSRAYMDVFKPKKKTLSKPMFRTTKSDAAGLWGRWFLA